MKSGLPRVVLSTFAVLSVFAFAVSFYSTHKSPIELIIPVKQYAVLSETNVLSRDLAGSGNQQTQQTSQTIQTKETLVTPQSLTDCSYQESDTPSYHLNFLGLEQKPQIARKEYFQVRVFFRNSSNETLFSANSKCKQNILNLGTDNARDRASVLYTKPSFWATNWLAANRIAMDQNRVEPGQIATFTFLSQAPDQDALLREFFTPVLEGKQWIDDAQFKVDLKVGNVSITPDQQRVYDLINNSTNLSAIDLNADKKLDVSLKDQKLKIEIGDQVIREMQVSTGKSSTPTPVGDNFQILLKQDVRVAGEEPHYIMPKFMMFKDGGFGFHALPSLSNDHGKFWTEALNHIGSARSHGCVRLLPDDADLVYNFADIGTKVSIHA